MSKFTYSHFKKMFPNDRACLDYIFQMRYGHLEACPECACKAEWRRVRTRKCYQCRHCYAQFYPTAETVFEKTRIPLLDWFYIIFLFTTTRNGVAAKEIERQLGVTYKTAFRIGHQVRKMMEQENILLKGFVEADETYMGKKREAIRTSGTGHKYPVFGMIERLGNVKAYAVDTANKATVYPLIVKHIDKDATLSTDEHQMYVKINAELSLKHGTVIHSQKMYRQGEFCTNTIEGYFSQLKRMVGGTHIHVSGKYLQAYVDESCYRYNMRKQQHAMFITLINRLPLVVE